MDIRVNQDRILVQNHNLKMDLKPNMITVCGIFPIGVCNDVLFNCILLQIEFISDQDKSRLGDDVVIGSDEASKSDFKNYIDLESGGYLTCYC